MKQICKWCLCVLSLFSTMCGIASAQEDWMPDANLRQAIRDRLELPADIPLLKTDMKRLTGLEGRKRGITDLTGLEHATYLQWTNLGENEIRDISPLAALVHLEGLWIYTNPISDLSPLANLVNLKQLNLGICEISDIRPLANLTRLERLWLHYNQIQDITPLANLTNLTELWLTGNRIIDVSPLRDVKNLTDLQIAGNAIRDFSPLLELNLQNVDIDIHTLHELAAVKVEIPDPNLELAVREALELPDAIPLTQLLMNQLTGLGAAQKEITDLTGLEYATHLQWAGLSENEIQDISPLANLVGLEGLWIYTNPISDLSPLANLTKLKQLNVAGCEISDLWPLSNLRNLEYLILSWNRIEDITPLANLTNLTELWLNGNRIVDYSPLANLVSLETLHIQDNPGVDISPLAHLTLSEFLFDEVCELGRLPTEARVNNRRYPSAFEAWDDIHNRPSLSPQERIAAHDLSFRGLWDFHIYFQYTDQGVVLRGPVEQARQRRDELLALNPNLIFVNTTVFMRDSYVNKLFPQDFPHWVRDATGTPVEGWPGTFLLDFTHPAVQDIIVSQALAVSRCGVFDGIFLDWWQEHTTVLDGYRSNVAEQSARDVIIRRIREAVGEDFLILVNANRSKPHRAAPYINGLYMETVRDAATGYTHAGLRGIESTMLWAENTLREPQIVCLEGWSIATEKPDPTLDYWATRVVDTPPDTPRNQQWMRLFTTLSLTHSDGYIHFYGGYLYDAPNTRTHRYGFWNAETGRPIGEPQQHYWYDFWDADLGQPIAETAQLHANREGVFIREFTNGWAVYNRSGVPQAIQLPEQATGVESGLRNTLHILPDLDGEIYLKSTTDTHDVNADGIVNILDLVAVANAFGKNAPDVNGDGVVNVLDLVAVANQFGQ